MYCNRIVTLTSIKLSCVRRQRSAHQAGSPCLARGSGRTAGTAGRTWRATYRLEVFFWVNPTGSFCFGPLVRSRIQVFINEARVCAISAISRYLRLPIFRTASHNHRQGYISPHEARIPSASYRSLVVSTVDQALLSASEQLWLQLAGSQHTTINTAAPSLRALRVSK